MNKEDKIILNNKIKESLDKDIKNLLTPSEYKELLKKILYD